MSTKQPLSPRSQKGKRRSLIDAFLGLQIELSSAPFGTGNDFGVKGFFSWGGLQRLLRDVRLYLRRFDLDDTLRLCLSVFSGEKGLENVDQYVHLCGCVTFFDGISKDGLVGAPSTRESSMHLFFGPPSLARRLSFVRVRR